jgi:sulfate adenylyltransferase subunit 2
MILVNGTKKPTSRLFDLLNGKIENGQNVRVFPISNWTELDVWRYRAKSN